MTIRYRLKQETHEPGPGVWTSEVLTAETMREVHQAVHAGWLNGSARWAIDANNGTRLCGLDAKGRAQ